MKMSLHSLEGEYRNIPKVTAPVTFGISSPKGPQLSGSSYFQVAVTFGQLTCEQSIPRNSLNEVNTSLKYFNPRKMYYLIIMKDIF